MKEGVFKKVNQCYTHLDSQTQRLYVCHKLKKNFIQSNYLNVSHKGLKLTP